MCEHGRIQGNGAGGGGGGGGGGGSDILSPSGIRPPADPKGPPLYYFEISIFGDGLQNFSKGQFIIILSGERVPVNFWPVFFFQKICLRRSKIGQIGVFIIIMIGESSENEFG